jgi:hypothetical protein
MTKPTDTKQPCKAERRHMPAHVFVTYDAMRASIDDEHIYYGGAHTLANLNNRNVDSERAALAWLEENGWIKSLSTQQRRWNGKMDTDKYRVLWHDEWFAAQPRRECPPDKYVKVGETWKLATPGDAAPGLFLRNVRRAVEVLRGQRPEAPEDELWLWVLAREAYKNLQREAARTGTGTPEPAAATGSPEPAQTTGTGGPEQAVTGAPEPTVTGPPVPTVTGAPVRSLTPSGNTSITPSPTIQPETRFGGGHEVFHDFAPSGAGDQDAEAIQALEAEERKQWQRFMTNLPEEMQGAILRKDYKPQLQAQIEASDVSVVLAALRLWIAERELPIADRKADRWGCWLAEGAPFLKRAVDNWRRRNREARLWDFKTKIAPSIPQAFFDSDLSFGKADRNNCEKVTVPTFLFPDFDQVTSFEKWEVATADLRSRYELWADKDDCAEVQELRADMRVRIAQRRAEAQAAKA